MRGTVDEKMADVMLDARRGDGSAALRLADMIQKIAKPSTTKSEFEAYVDYIQSIYVYAAQHGSDDAAYRLALLNYNAIGGPEHSEEGVYWLLSAARRGKRELWMMTLMLFMEGRGGVPANPEEGRNFFSYVLEKVTGGSDLSGAEDCIGQMALYLSEGKVLPEDDQKAEELYLMLVKAGKLSGLEGLEDLYGKICPDDPTKIFAARLLYGEATDDRFDYQTTAWKQLCQAEGEQQQQLLRIVKNGAVEGKAYSQLLLARAYHKAVGVPKNKFRRFYWTLRAVQSGSLTALFEYFMLKVRQDYNRLGLVESVRKHAGMLKRAAEGNDEGAKLFYAMAMLSGTDIYHSTIEEREKAMAELTSYKMVNLTISGTIFAGILRVLGYHVRRDIAAGTKLLADANRNWGNHGIDEPVEQMFAALYYMDSPLQKVKELIRHHRCEEVVDPMRRTNALQCVDRVIKMIESLKQD